MGNFPLNFWSLAHLGKNRKVGKSRKVDVVKNKMHSLGLIYKKSFLNILVEKKKFLPIVSKPHV